MRYKVFFEDNSKFFGGNPRNSKWDLIPNKPIKKLVYYLKAKRIELSGYEKYNIMTERIAIINGRGQFITKLFIMGNKEKETHQFIVDFQKKKFYKNKTLVNCEYKGKPVSGWKKGIKGSKAIMKIT